MGAIDEPIADDQDGPDARAALHAAAAGAHPEAAKSTRASSSRTACGSTRPPEGYEIFNDKQDECMKVVLKAA